MGKLNGAIILKRLNAESSFLVIGRIKKPFKVSF